MPLSAQLDLELAWRRLKQDRPDRCFVTHPHLLGWIESDRSEWLRSVAAKVDKGYPPHDCETCYAPKPNWMVRPGGVLDLEDELVFNAILGSFHKAIWKGIGWAQGDPDAGYRLSQPTKTPLWVKNDFLIWNEWRTRSLEKLEGGVFHVLLTDIAGFYENIDLGRLASDLKSLGVNDPLLQVLMKCLNRWAHPRAKGIPQGFSGSDILAKIYMDPIDRGMRNAGFTHLRYVDDTRVFCKTNLEAKHALLTLNDLLRRRGLNLQSSKTEILRADDAKRRIDGITPLIHSIGAELTKELQAVAKLSGPYSTLDDIERIVASHPDSPAPEILERAFSENFLDSSSRFDKTLFHYLLTRLGKANSKVAVAFCLRTLQGRPEETRYCLRYFKEIGVSPLMMKRILTYAGSPEAIYDYQLFEIVRWFHENEFSSKRLVKLARTWAFDRNRPSWLRAYCLAALAKKADPADVEAIEGQYGHATTDVEKAQVVMSLTKMETGRRNGFLARIKDDGELVRRAVKQVRNSN